MNEQSQLNAIARYADNAGLSYTFSSHNGRQFLVVEVSKSWSLLNLGVCLMDSAFSLGRATDPISNADAVLHEGFAYIAVSRHNGDGPGLTLEDCGLVLTSEATPFEEDEDIPTAADANATATTNFGEALRSLKSAIARNIRNAAALGEYTITLTGSPYSEINNPLRQTLVNDLREKGYACADSVSAVDPGLPYRAALVVSWTPARKAVRGADGRLSSAPIGKIPDGNALTHTTAQGN